MKSSIKILTLFLVLTTSCVILPRQTDAQQTNVSFQVFYDQLSPYGQWIDDSNYGYVWIPDAGSDFVPYSTDGHWLLTDYGWTWASDYSWGWATFHYGRWSYTNAVGWFWIPDTEWGPAWVNWRQADGYYGWSPMEPGISVSMSFGSEYDNQNNHWIFIRDRDIERQDINHYYVDHADRDRIGRGSRVINNTYIDNSRHTTYVSGPSRNQVQQVTGRTITPVVIRDNNKPGQELNNGQIRIYRPQVVKNNTDGRKPAPARVINRNDVKRTPANNATNQNKIVTPANRIVPEQIKTVEPQQNHTVQPVQQRTINQQDNQQVLPTRNFTPATPNRTVQPVQVIPTDNNRPVRKPDAVTPQNTNPQQPVQQRTVTPQNTPQQVQQRTVIPQNNTPQPVPQRTVTPQNNFPKPVQQTAPAKIENKTQPVQPQTVNPANNRPVVKQKVIKQKIRKVKPKAPDVVNDKK